MNQLLSLLAPRNIGGFTCGIALVVILAFMLMLCGIVNAVVLPFSHLFAATLFGLVLGGAVFAFVRLITFSVVRNLDGTGMIVGSFVAFVLGLTAVL